MFETSESERDAGTFREVPAIYIEDNHGSGIDRDDGAVEIHIGDMEPSPNEESIRQTVTEIATRIYNSFRKSPAVYLSNIFRYRDQRELERLIEIFRGGPNVQSGYRKLFILSAHDRGDESGHLHVVHDCPYSNNSCRCSAFTQAKKEGYYVRPLGRRVYCNQITIEGCENIIFYFLKEHNGWEVHTDRPDSNGHFKRERMVTFRVEGSVPRVPSGYQDYQKRRSDRRAKKRSMEESMEEDIPELREQLETGEINSRLTRTRRSAENKSRVRRPNGARLQSKIEMMCHLYPCCPVENVMNLTVYLSDPELRYIRKTNKQFEEAIDAFCAELTNWSIFDFHDLYSKPDCQPKFMGGNRFDEIYMSQEESLDVIIEFLEYQFEADHEVILSFLTELYNILERKKPKHNCILILSPPDSGKNFFFDVFFSYYLSYCVLQQANKHNNFAFQDIYNKRIIHWNEPNYDSIHHDFMKLLLGGDNAFVNVKHRSNSSVMRTPVIMTTNNIISVMGDPAFNSRMTQWRWKRAPYLVKYTKKPHPFVAWDLFVKYGIIKEE